MSKKIIIIEAATKVIEREGVDHFTLASVAEEAGMSKGGLLYHFKNKESLIIAMNHEVIDRFRSLLSEFMGQDNTFHEAYVLATEVLVKEKFAFTTSFIASIASDRDILKVWQEEYEYFHTQFAKENYSNEMTLLVKTICDGLWFAPIFHTNHLNHPEITMIIQYVLKQLRKEK